MPYNVAIVSYINSYPFVYGLKKFQDELNLNLILSPPSACASLVFENKVDFALVPVAALPRIGKHYSILPEFCIGAIKSVASVLLLSYNDIKNIDRIYMDKQSLTSVNLTKILAKQYWRIKPEFVDADIETLKNISKNEALLVIGDKCFELRNSFPFVYDIFDEWHAFKNLPFVFAVWVAVKNTDPILLHNFTKALSYGEENKIDALKDKLPDEKLKDIAFYSEYLNSNISYNFDNKKMEALSLFLDMLKSID